jgi:hypothetical protein
MEQTPPALVTSANYTVTVDSLLLTLSPTAWFMPQGMAITLFEAREPVQFSPQPSLQKLYCSWQK